MKTRNLKNAVTALTFIFAIVVSFAFTSEKPSDSGVIYGYYQSPSNCEDIGLVECCLEGPNNCMYGFVQVFKNKNGTQCNTKLFRE